MKRIIIIIMAMLEFFSAGAKEFAYDFHETPISEAVVELCRDHPEINIAFIYRELDKYTTSANFDTDDIETALRRIIGFHPIMLSSRNGMYYLEALQQGKYTYKGRVTDSAMEPLPGASVYMISPRDSVVVSYSVTDGNGEFRIPCDRKNLTAKVSCVGFVTVYQPANGYNIGTILLRENPIALKAITIEEEGAVLSTDKNTYMPTQRQKKYSSTGQDLLRLMAIPTLITTPGSNTITDVFGNKCDVFINYSPASEEDLKALNISNVRKVEVYDSPSDPRFRGARKAINIIVQEYAYGGYTKVMASETCLNGFSNKANVYNKFTFKRMTYDLYVGALNSNNRHSGEDAHTEYSLADGVVSTTENTEVSRTIENSYPVTFRATLNSKRIQVQNLVSFTHESAPEHSYAGQIAFDTYPNKDYFFKRNNKARANSVNYSGSIYWWHPSDFAIDYSQSVSYDHRNDFSMYRTGAMNFPIENIALEDRTNLRAGLYAMKAFGAKHRVKFGGRVIYLKDNVAYRNDADYADCMHTAAGNIAAQYVFSTKRFNLSSNFGLGFERISVNDTRQNETTPFGDANFSWKIDKKNSLSTYVSFGVNTPGVDMRQDVVVRDNEFLYLTGNTSLADYRELKTNLAYNLFLNNRLNCAAFGGYEESFNRVATIYSPYGEDALIRSFINDGNYSNLYFGASANLKLLNKSLQLYANVTQKFLRTSGLYSNRLNPLRIQLQAAYYFKAFYALAAFTSRNSVLTENSNIIIKGRDTYVFEAGWGNGAWVISLSARNIFRNRWDSETWTQETPLYGKWKTIYSPSSHSSLNLSVTYTVGYGKKTRRGNEVGASSSNPSAIIKQ